jgi:hypothetical protein
MPMKTIIVNILLLDIIILGVGVLVGTKAKGAIMV